MISPSLCPSLPSPLFSTSASSPPCPSSTLLPANSRPPSDPFIGISSAASIPCLEDHARGCRYGFPALLTPPARSLGSSAAHLSSKFPMAPNVRCSLGIPHSNKRLCKASGSLNSGPRVSDCNLILDPRHRIAAFNGDGGSQLSPELVDDDDAPQNKKKKKAPGKMKSAEELHFEAIEEYCRRYENEGKGGYAGDSSIYSAEGDAASLEDMRSPVINHASAFGGDGLNSPINESKYLDASEVLPRYRDSIRSQSNGCKNENMLQGGPPIGINEKRSPGIVSQSINNGNVSGSGELKNGYVSTGSAQITEALKHKGTIPKVRRKVTVDDHSLDDPQHRIEKEALKAEKWQSQNGFSKLEIKSTSSDRNGNFSHKQNRLDTDDALQTERRQAQNRCSESSSDGIGNLIQGKRLLNEEAVLQTEQYEPQNMDSKLEVASSDFAGAGELSQDQKIRMELNKAAALARRNMRICEESVAQAQVKGLPFPNFESLLVEKSWVEVLGMEFQKAYMERLHRFVSQEAAGRDPIYPPPAKLFNAFNSCPFDKVKVVIIGQDPYHGPGQAMGLCFSVEKGIKFPSSLMNIFLEIQSDLGCDFPSHGNLEKWAHQGVLLMNTVLTVRDRHANSHAKKGWELFTDAAIRTLVQQRSGVIFLLWGNQAQEKLRLINKTCHHILKAPHPSGISAHRGFFKCRHFSKTNQILVDQGLLPIDWQL